MGDTCMYVRLRRTPSATRTDTLWPDPPLCRSLLNEPGEHQNPVVVPAEQHAGDSVARQRTAHLPQPCLERTAEGRAHRPAILHAHQILSNRIAVRFIDRKSTSLNSSH